MQGNPEQQIDARVVLAKAKLELVRNERSWKALAMELQDKATRLTADLCKPAPAETSPYEQGMLRGQLKVIGEILAGPQRWLTDLQAAQADHTLLRKNAERAKLQAEAFGADPEAQQLVQGISP